MGTKRSSRVYADVISVETKFLCNSERCEWACVIAVARGATVELVFQARTASHFQYMVLCVIAHLLIDANDVLCHWAIAEQKQSSACKRIAVVKTHSIDELKQLSSANKSVFVTASSELVQSREFKEAMHDETVALVQVYEEFVKLGLGVLQVVVLLLSGECE
jgi:hypothetical protein